MSMVFAGVEVAGGPTVELKDHVAIPVYLQQHGDDNNNNHKGEEEKGKRKERNGFFIEEKVVEEESSETSSIGVQSSDSSLERDEEEEEVQSKAKDGAFVSIDSLEESLPIKRGLSNFFSGKSKSFASLADVATMTARDPLKPENPFNKRRRASYACLPPFMSDHIAEDEDEENSGDSSTLAPLPPDVSKERKIEAFRSPRSFSLSDLQNVWLLSY